MEILNRLKNLDAYPKINEDFYSRTLSGGVITLLSSIAIFLLVLSEFRLYLSSGTETKLIVDTSRGEKLRINFDITFPALACSLLSVDTVDISGEQHYDIIHDITKKRIDHLGKVIESRTDVVGAPKIERPLQKHGGRLAQNETYCGSCYGAEEVHLAHYSIQLQSQSLSDDHCCNSCEAVREAYQKRGWGLTNPELIDQCQREGFFQKIVEQEGEGCNIHGFLEVNKVAGNFHFASGKSFHSNNHLQDILSLPTDGYNISHRINKLTFGENFPGVINPLDGVEWSQDDTLSGVYQYFIKVVPTIYTDIRGRKIHSNQFSVTEHYKHNDVYSKPLPGVFFIYDFSPIKVIFNEGKMSFLHFLTNVCAVVGGVFSVAGIVDALFYHGQKAIKKKIEIGKYG